MVKLLSCRYKLYLFSALTVDAVRKQTFGAPRQVPLKSSAKIPVINDGVVPEMQPVIPRTPTIVTTN